MEDDDVVRGGASVGAPRTDGPGPDPNTRINPAPPTLLQASASAGDLLVLVGTYDLIMWTFQLYSGDPLRLVMWSTALAAVWLAVALRGGAYQPSVLRQRLQSAYVAGKLTVLSGSIFHLLPLVGGPVDSRITSATVVLTLTIAIGVWRFLFSYLAGTAIVDEPTDLLVVGTGAAAMALDRALAARPHAGMRIVAFIDPNPDRSSGLAADPAVQPVSRLSELVRASRRAPRVVLATSEQTHAAVYDQLTALAQEGIEIVGVATVYEQATGCVPVWHLGDSWWAVLPRPSADLLYAVVKRGVDIVGASVGLLLLLLFLPLLAPLLRQETRGSLLFRQTRVGRHGQEFTLHKVRTLPTTPTTFQDHWQRKNANSAAPLGRMVRMLGFDELPQCWNVLKGEMSLIGPRPYVPEEVADFQQRIPFFRSRALVPPGITGWAQVNWGYGLSIDDEVEKLQYDLFYIGHQSVYLDLLILFRTAKLVVRQRRFSTTAQIAIAGR